MSDGRHLWLAVETTGEDGDQVQVYYRSADDPAGQMHALAPIDGRLRPGGFTAGGGRLILLMDDGRLLTRTPYLPPMSWGWEYRAGELAPMPDGCALLSLLAHDQAVWALVRVDAPEVLAALDAPPAGVLSVEQADRLNMILGLPPGVERAGRRETEHETPADAAEGDGSEDDAGSADPDPVAPGDTPTEGEPNPPADGETPAGLEPDEADDALDTQPPAPTVPAYRLLKSDARGWRSVPLPAGFGEPSRAVLLSRNGQDHLPAMVTQANWRDSVLTVYLPDEDAGWAPTPYFMHARQTWSAAVVSGQVMIAQERSRGFDQVVVDLYLLRSRRAVSSGVLWVNTTDTARWRLLGQDGSALLVARPGPLAPAPEGVAPPETLMGGYRLASAMFGTGRPAEGDAPLGEHVTYLAETRSRWESNADWLIQIAALAGALLLLTFFWKRTPRSREVRLPAHIHLVPWSRRLISTCIDLAPGLWIAGAAYGLGWDELILRHWPGTPIAKPPAAMWPGWLVIGITVFHTTAFEFITARSIGKWLTGIYVSDFRGVPAPPGASLVRAVMRVFDLVAWMLLLLPLISPHRQRLGDILAKTLVVYRDPPEEDKPSEDD